MVSGPSFDKERVAMYEGKTTVAGWKLLADILAALLGQQHQQPSASACST